MPKFLFATFNSDAKTNFSKWRQLTNQGETMDKKHLVDTSSDDVDTGTEKPLKKTGKKKGKQNRRVTKTRRVGIQDDVLQIKLTSSDEQYISSVSESIEALPIYFTNLSIRSVSTPY